MKRFALLIACAGGLPLAGADAGEFWTGAYVHDVDTPFTKSGIEHGADIELGWRGAPIAALGFLGGPSPYAFGSVNTAGDTDFAAAGLGWRLGGQVYLRPGIGIAVHDAPSRPAPGSDRIDFGSRVLFELEGSLGVKLDERFALEASWVHLSHAQIFGRQNPGIDNFGVRLAYRFR